MKKFVLYTVCCSLTVFLQAQVSGDEDREMFNKAKDRDQRAIDSAQKNWWNASMQTRDQRLAWWRAGKFGMFVHWGIYSLPAGEWKGKEVNGYAEHLMRKEKITRKEYSELAHRFNPLAFDADKWMQQLKTAGMTYFVITAKHHDGFAMYPSAVSDFDIEDQTAFKRDPMAELAAVAKKYGIKFGFYYSHAFDWEDPDAPGNDWEYNNPGGDKKIGGENWFDAHPEWLPKAQRYVTNKAIPQIVELISKYHPDILWFDTPHKLPLSENIRILAAIRTADPDIVVNGRLVRSAAANFGDYKNTADRPAEFYPVEGDWEAIPTTNESYGYHQYDNSHKPAGHFIRLLASAAAKGGNLLMNIGPKGDGSFDTKDITILEGIGSWMKKNGESIYGTSSSSLPLYNWGVTTTKNNNIYLHVFSWPADRKLYLGKLKGNIKQAGLLSNRTVKINVAQNPGGETWLNLPATAPDSINSVIVLEVSGKLEPADRDLYIISPGVTVNRLLAFNATQKGEGFAFGDGKTDRYYLERWKKPTQQLEWKIQNENRQQYRIIVKYLAPAATAGGRYRLAIDQQPYSASKHTVIDKPVRTTAKQTEVVTVSEDTVTLDKGVYTLSIAPLAFGAEELMKLLEIQLVPVK